MNKLIIPPPANWFECYITACAIDDTFIYGARNGLVVIPPSLPDQPADIKIMPRCHRERITAVMVNSNWGSPDKIAVSLGDDKVVSAWDMATYELKSSHAAHTTRSAKVVGITFAGNDKVISVSEDGFIVIWRLGANEVNPLSDVLGPKVRVACISSCPHAPWMTAFGLKRGEILVTDLRKTGKVLYRLKGHDDVVISLSWCPTPFGVFPPKQPKQKQEVKTSQLSIRILKRVPEVGNTSGTVKIAVSEETEVNNTSETAEIAISENKTVTDVTSTAGEDAMAVPELETKTENVSPVPTDEIVTVTTSIIPLEEVSPLVMEVPVMEDLTEKSEPPSIVSIEADPNKCELDNTPKQTEATKESGEAKESLVEIQQPQDKVEKLLEHQGLQVSEHPGLVEAQFDSSKEVVQDVETLEISHSSKEVVEGIEASEIEQSIENQVDEVVPDPAAENEVAAPASPTKEYLLASAARGGKSVVIWSPGASGIKRLELNMPGVHRSARYEEKSWIALCWVTPKGLLTSTHKGELLLWNLPAVAAGLKGHKWRMIHNDHNRQLFSIAAPTRIYQSADDEDWRDRNLLNAWTVGKDRFILNTSLNADHKTLTLYPTIMASVFCMASSPTVPCRIAIGAGGGVIRFWDLSLPHLTHIIMTQFNDKLQNKIVDVAWHPEQETMLAYANVDGRIGIMNPCICNSTQIYLTQHANATVHRLQWGPLNGNQEILGLYVLIGGYLIVYDVSKQYQAPVEIDFGADVLVSQIAWKPDRTMCAVSTKAGSLMLLSADLQVVKTLYLQEKGVHWMEWHPQATVEDSDVSIYANWLAVGGRSVSVYDCNSSEMDYAERVVAIFTDHTKSSKSVSWSTFEGGKLASAGDDGRALVWDVKTKTLLHSCVTPNTEMLQAVLWSPRDQDYIITGSKEGTIQIWKLSENPPQSKIAKKQKVPRILGTADTGNGGNLDDAQEAQRLKIGTRKYVLQFLAETQNVNDTARLLQDCSRMWELRCDNGASGSQNGDTTDEPKQADILQLFGNQTDLSKMCQLEKEYHAMEKPSYCAQQISLWQGDLGSSIKEAIAMKTLTPWIISMAPVISHSLYHEACEAYAKQLSENADSCAFEISSYYLACHKLDEAVEILCERRKFREALCLAKWRVVPTDPLINRITERWATTSVSMGNFEIAAQCYLALDRPADAAKVLYRRGDLNSLELCAKMGEACGEDLLEAVLFRLHSLRESTVVEPKETLTPLPTRLEAEIRLLNLNRENGCDEGNAGGAENRREVIEAESNGHEVALGDGQCVAKVDKILSDETEDSPTTNQVENVENPS